MEFKNKKPPFSPENKRYAISLIEEGYPATKASKMMCEHFGLVYNENIGRQYRKMAVKVGIANSHTDFDEHLENAKTKQFDSKKKRFIITWGQQETDIHEGFLTNLEAYGNHINAELLIIAGRYKSPTSLEASNSQKKKDKNKGNWNPRLTPYLIASRQNLHKYLTVLADLKVQPTASTPLTGLNGITALESCIIGHPRVHLKSLPILDGYPNKLMLTTGAVTVENYTDTKVGKKGEFNHTLGFIIIELDGDIFHSRQVQCDHDGNFYDLIYKAENGKISLSKEKYPAVIFGDLHLVNENKDAIKASFKIADKLRCKDIILHDVMEGQAISHHELNNPVLLAQRELDGTGCLKKELDYITKWFNKRKEYKFISVMSNHNAFIDRWILTNDWRKNPNRAIYLDLANVVMNGRAPKGILAYILDKDTTNVKSLGYNESYRIGDWELGMHGDIGVNGSRGSIIQFKNLNTKNVTAHGHSPNREDGALIVGTLTNLKLNYVKGLSSWMHSNVVIYPNMKASHIHIIKGKFTTLF